MYDSVQVQPNEFYALRLLSSNTILFFLLSSKNWCSQRSKTQLITSSTCAEETPTINFRLLTLHLKRNQQPTREKLMNFDANMFKQINSKQLASVKTRCQTKHAHMKRAHRSCNLNGHQYMQLNDHAATTIIFTFVSLPDKQFQQPTQASPWLNHVQAAQLEQNPTGIPNVQPSRTTS